MTITTSVHDDGTFTASISVSSDHQRATLRGDLVDAITEAPTRLDGSRAVQVWLENVRDEDDDVLAAVARPYRDLLQLRRPLPAPPSGIDTRPFEFERDADNFIGVNNRAFEWHPEQSGMDHRRLNQSIAEPWFDADGFRILELEGQMAGFCWTKVHTDHTPAIGEIYVIAIDPAFHGRGLGGPMTLAGLEWLAGRGITMSNLYVESDNHAAVRTYEKLGFEVHSINRAYSTASDD